MQNDWILNFLRLTLLNGQGVESLEQWCNQLLDALSGCKPDHELHVLGLNRLPRLPHFLVASSSEKLPEGRETLAVLGKRTAEALLGAEGPGVRFVQQEMPMAVHYRALGPEGEAKTVELQFYDAVCFDGPEHTLVLALILTECEATEFLAPEELSELLPLIRSLAIPLLETATSRYQRLRTEKDMMSLLNLVQSSNPEINTEGVLRTDDTTFVEREADDREFSPQFLLYLAQELRAATNTILATNEKLVEMCGTSLGSPELAGMAQTVQGAARFQSDVLRNLANLAALSQGPVRPQVAPFAMQAFIREVYPAAVQMASRFEVRIKLEEYTRNIFLHSDHKTLVRMSERLMHAMMQHCRGGHFYLRTDDNPEKVESGNVAIEFEDSGELPDAPPLHQLLSAEVLAAGAHPRLRRGGGVLLQLLQVFSEKCGGSFTLRKGDHGGFCVRLILPQVSRAEMEKIKAGEVAI